MSMLTRMVIPAIALLALVSCRGQGHRIDEINRPVPQPPAVPARQSVPIDPLLQGLAKQEIMTAMTSNSPLVRAHAVEAMKDGLGDAAAAPILKALGDEDPLVRFAACLAAGELRLPGARQPALALCDDPDPAVRIGARFALHRLGDYRKSQDFGAFSKDVDPRTRGNTALVLGLLDEPSATRILRPMLRDRSPAVRMQASEALWRLGDVEGRDNLISASVSAYPDDQMIAILALAEPHNRQVIAHVRGALTSPWDEVTLVAARAMGMLGSDEGYGVAMKGVKSADPRQRHLAALAFGAIGRTDAQPYLEPLLKDSDPDVRLASATALLQLKMQ
jgi:HEAT repeat protein